MIKIVMCLCLSIFLGAMLSSCGNKGETDTSPTLHNKTDYAFKVVGCPKLLLNKDNLNKDDQFLQSGQSARYDKQVLIRNLDDPNDNTVSGCNFNGMDGNTYFSLECLDHGCGAVMVEPTRRLGGQFLIC